MRRFAVFVCSVGYVGFFPFAPGTLGSAAGILLYVICRSAGIPEIPVIIGLFALGVALTVPAEQALGCVDPGPIVIDEVMGMMITLALVPVGWGGMLLGFLLFRALDVFKPFPARQLEHLHGGFGVMCDDAMAAVYANLLLRGAYYLAPGWIA
jgi:phosphatidylglycerophosphatase A